jgi:hypothetical protein
MEATHELIDEERSIEKDILQEKVIFDRNRSFNQNTNSNFDIESPDFNINSVGFSNEAIMAQLNNKQEKILNYKNKKFPILNYDEEIDPKEQIAENLSKLFEKMVYQLEIVTRYIIKINYKFKI